MFQAVNERYKNEGIEALTLEKIAKRAGISKGGMLYHFPTKDAILIGLVERSLKAFTEDVKKLIDEIDAVDEKKRAEKLEYFTSSNYRVLFFRGFKHPGSLYQANDEKR